MRSFIDFLFANSFIVFIVAFLCSMSIASAANQGKLGMARLLTAVAFIGLVLVCAIDIMRFISSQSVWTLVFAVLNGYWAVQIYRNYVTTLFRS